MSTTDEGIMSTDDAEEGRLATLGDADELLERLESEQFREQLDSGLQGDELLAQLGSSRLGLSGGEAKRRLASFGRTPSRRSAGAPFRSWHRSSGARSPG